MILDEIVSWYQKKIGTYDKEKWEQTVEQKILAGFSSIALKTTKLKEDLIDVDLVRGSTFPKAKPKQTLLTVIRLAILRYLFLPLYAQWWCMQTSPNVFALLLLLYAGQMVNLAVYTNVEQQTASDTIKNVTLTKANTESAAAETDQVVTLSELLIPMVLSLLLSLIHSQIVATHIVQSGSKSKRRRYSNTNLSGKQSKDHQRTRRRRKLVKLRSQDVIEASTGANQSQSQIQKQLRKAIVVPPPELTASTNKNNIETSTINPATLCSSSSLSKPKQSLASTALSQHAFQLDLNHFKADEEQTKDNSQNDTECLIRKRNVNWHSPLHKYADAVTTNASGKQTLEKQQQTSPQSLSTATSSTRTSQIENCSSSVSSNDCSNASSPMKTVRIDECVQEFYDDLIQRTSTSNELAAAAAPTRGDDDGFESLNGKSSSGEDINFSPNAPRNQLRLRLNVTTASGENQQHRIQELNEPSTTVNTTNTTNPNNAYRRKTTHETRDISSEETEEDGDDGEIISSPASQCNTSNYNECTTSATEWLGITTNSDECSYSSNYDNSDDYKGNQYSHDGCDMDFTPTTILNPHGITDRISCTIWDAREIKKAQMSVLEISSCIIEHVESMPETNDYIYIGLFFSFVLSLIPCFCRLCEVTIDAEKEMNYFDLPMLLWEKASFSTNNSTTIFQTIFRFAFGHTQWERTVLILSFLQRLCLSLILFMIFAVAERTFKQRFLYAKLFSHLTSSRRARKSNLPHFRLNKVRNIKTWLSVRSYLKKRGPQRSVDIIVSAAFIVTLLLLAFLSVEWLKDSVHLHSHLNLEALMWSTTIGIFLLRFMTLGNKIHHKYRSVSVLITEQINLYLQIEKKPKKKDELMVSNSVLKLAADLLKELETPFKISGLSANPYLFTTIKVVILSALSGVLSEMLGFKLKLHKIKIK